MQLVYTHPNAVLVVQAQASLELAGIKCTLRNEYAAGAIGELAPIDAWPELWVIDDSEFEQATRLIGQSRAVLDEPDWQCGQCGSSSPASFDFCWQCGAERPQ
jgi:hypothetical protein